MFDRRARYGSGFARLTAALICALAISACGRHDSEHGHDGVLKRAQGYQGEKADVNGDQWQPLTKRHVIDDLPEFPAFEAEAREPLLKHAPCTRCHLEDGTAMRPSDVQEQAAHWDVSLKHARAEVMGCETCHNKEAQMAELHTLTGNAISFDRPDQLCGQCHFKQREEWAGGAHGKRLGNWAGSRMVQNCTGCHNPHSPAFEARMPAISPTPVPPERSH